MRDNPSAPSSLNSRGSMSHLHWHGGGQEPVAADQRCEWKIHTDRNNHRVGWGLPAIQIRLDGTVQIIEEAAFRRAAPYVLIDETLIAPVRKQLQASPDAALHLRWPSLKTPGVAR